MFDIIKVAQSASHFDVFTNTNTTSDPIGEWFLPGEIQCGIIQKDVWQTAPFPSNIEFKVAKGLGPIYYIAIPQHIDKVVIALVQELTESTVAVTPVYVYGYDIPLNKTVYCEKKVQ